ncbi:uncharacterized protein ARMOST_16906 [Armillaria ostoyae]|uniref:Uncharacterized protein n=1 Tax=Armillaria ostoyae TaxID=47428 RepID=A0A284RXJ8_ARMOS|nr:uncharacterized protein ARMOST_16906 [Armillaria ostoyae]
MSITWLGGNKSTIKARGPGDVMLLGFFLTAHYRRSDSRTSDVICWASVDGKDCYCIGHGAVAGPRSTLRHDRHQRGILAIDVKDGGCPAEHRYTHQGRDRTRQRRGRRVDRSLTGATKLEN